MTFSEINTLGFRIFIETAAYEHVRDRLISNDITYTELKEILLDPDEVTTNEGHNRRGIERYHRSFGTHGNLVVPVRAVAMNEKVVGYGTSEIEGRSLVTCYPGPVSGATIWKR